MLNNGSATTDKKSISEDFNDFFIDNSPNVQWQNELDNGWMDPWLTQYFIDWISE